MRPLVPLPWGFAALGATCRMVGAGATTGSDLTGPDSFARVTPLVIDSTDNRLVSTMRTYPSSPHHRVRLSIAPMVGQFDRSFQFGQGPQIVRTTLGSNVVARAMGARLHRCVGCTDNRAHPTPERSAASHAALVIVLMLAGMVV